TIEKDVEVAVTEPLVDQAAQAMLGGAELGGKTADRQPLLAIRSVMIHETAQACEQPCIVVAFGSLTGTWRCGRPEWRDRERLRLGLTKRNKRAFAADRAQNDREHHRDRQQSRADGERKPLAAAAVRKKRLGRNDGGR